MKLTVFFDLTPFTNVKINLWLEALSQLIEEGFATRLNKKKDKLQSFKLTFILHPCDLDPDKGFFHLRGNWKKTISVQMELYTVTFTIQVRIHYKGQSEIKIETM